MDQADQKNNSDIINALTIGLNWGACRFFLKKNRSIIRLISIVHYKACVRATDPYTVYYSDLMKYAIKLPDPIPFTKEGYEKVKRDIEFYTEKRKTAVINLRTARDMGDLSENAAYKVARFELNDIDRQLRNLKFQLRFGVVTAENNKDIVDFGSEITLSDGKKEITFSLVGAYESDPGAGKLSIKSPIGRAVMHKKVGETIFVRAPMGDVKYTIVRVG